LLRHGLDTGGVLASVDAADRPVGYLLAVGVSFASAVGESERPAPRERRSARGAHLAELVVAPAHRREGRGGELLDTLRSRVEGSVTLAVGPENDAALALYRSRGFEPVRRLPDYFERGPALWLVG
jgi:ribosomal-protein-alanine N-acetyltransferase